VRSVARTAYRYLALLFLLGVIAEFFLAGLGVFRTQHVATKAGTTLTTAAFNHSFDPHLVLGDALLALSLVLCVAAFASRMGRRAQWTAVALFVVLGVQAMLAFAGPAAVRALHPVLGLLVVGAAIQIAMNARRGQVPDAS
jgi:Family of unknown function (DUF6220)